MLEGPEGYASVRHAVSLNAGAALYAYGAVEDIGQGYRLALAAFADGRVQKKLEEVCFLSKELA
jgi:anthranilate phosphoribosyltransferase